MAFTIYNKFNFLFKQTGSYITAEDRTLWGANGMPAKTGYHFAMSWVEFDGTVDGIPYNFMAQQENEDLRFYASINQEYHIRMYATLEWVAATNYVVDDIVWHNNKYWVSLTINSASEPGNTLADWKEIIDGDDDKLNTVAYRMDGFCLPVNTCEESNFRITKTDDHNFTVEWIGDGVATTYRLLNYKGDEIEIGTVESNSHDFVFEMDGLYIVEYLVDGTTHFAEVYDFSDAEKCYLDLMRNILCECADCDDCPGKNYDRALNFANMYQMIRDMSCVNQTIDSTILRSDYVNQMGLVIAKLGLMADSCLCKEDNNGK